ncbi:DUF6503 family protein [Aquimarina hainanensis]|uniref:DUF6503 family protein n=1 Tax=Aquimarina hainanensis TaxID=1578017 RepID=A0ABW5N807_9FLAO
MKYLWIFITLLILSSCNQNKKEQSLPDTTNKTTVDQKEIESDKGIGDGALSLGEQLINDVEKAHHKNTFLTHKAVSFDIAVRFGGKVRMDATITMATNSSKIKIQNKNGSTHLYTNDSIYIHPENTPKQGVRFGMFTWTYFFAFPYKLSDSGTQWEFQQDRQLNDTIYQTSKLTFKKGTGDAPDDWYITFIHPENKKIQAASYIVTYGNNGDISKAEADPHLIKYEQYKEINGVPFATQWGFYGWSEKEGLKEKLGDASISNIRFIEDDNSLFTPHPDAIPLQ